MSQRRFSTGAWIEVFGIDRKEKLVERESLAREEKLSFAKKNSVARFLNMSDMELIPFAESVC